MKRISFLSVIAVLSLLFFSACEKENVDTGNENAVTMTPEVETMSSQKDSLCVVSLTGRVSGLKSVTEEFECGIEYSTDSSFVQDNTIRQKVDKEYSEDPYTVTITNAVSGQTYYYRAYCSYQSLMYYGDVKDFTFTWDVDQIGFENGYQFIDLGLTVKWATFNVGATKPEEYGDYFAWGETEPKSDYDWPTYKWCNGSENSLTKYCEVEDYGNEGYTDNRNILEPEDDVAHVKWGGNWRLPTAEELEELMKHCEWEWYDADNSEFNGVAGYKVTSFKEGYTDCYIFLPAAGYRFASNIYDDGFYGGYWSSTIYTSLPYYVETLFSVSYFFEPCNYSRQNGLSVRAVCP